MKLDVVPVQKRIGLLEQKKVSFGVCHYVIFAIVKLHFPSKTKPDRKKKYRFDQLAETITIKEKIKKMFLI